MDQQSVDKILAQFIEIDPDYLNHPPALTDPYVYVPPGGAYTPIEEKLAAIPRKGKTGLRVLLVYSNNMFDTLVHAGLGILSSGLKSAGHEVQFFDTTFYHTEQYTSLKTTGDEARAGTLQVIPTNYSKYGIHFEKGDVIEDFKKIIVEFQPDLIGVSVLEMTHFLGVSLANAIADPKFLKSAGYTKPIPTIFGGPHVSSFGEKGYINEPNIDMLGFREGYPALVELANAIYKRESITNIPNIWTKDKQGNPVFPTPRFREPMDLDLLPEQDWTIWQGKRFLKPMGGVVRPTGVVIWQQGCPYACDFCIQNRYRVLDGRSNFRERPMDKVVKEVKEKTARYGIQYWYIIAENALPVGKTEKFMESFWEFVRNWGCQAKLPFWLETRPETLQEEFRVKALAAAGCEGISVGVESGDVDIRTRIMSRYMTDETILNAFDNLTTYGQLDRWRLEAEDLPGGFRRELSEKPQKPDKEGWFYTSKFRIRVVEKEDYNQDEGSHPMIRGTANTIIGVPGESRETIMKTVRLAKRMNHSGRVGVMFNVFIPLGGTEARHLAREVRLIHENHLVGDYRDPNQALSQPTLPADELRGIARCCPLYVAFDESRWDEIRRAETDNDLFQKLAEEFRIKFMVIAQERKRIITPKFAVVDESGMDDELLSVT